MVRFLEELSMNAWPALQTELYDGWVLRYANGYTKRANSVNPIYPSSLPTHEKIAYCERCYESRGLPVVFKLTQESEAIDKALEEQGYRLIDEVSVRVLALDQWEPVDETVDVHAGFDPAWLDHQFRLSGHHSDTNLATAAQMLQHLRQETFYATKIADGSQAACGLGVMERGYIGIFDIIVASVHRRKGFGKEMMNALLNHGKQSGAHYAYLQVVAGNTPAENLYASLGFQEAYRYWYRVK